MTFSPRSSVGLPVPGAPPARSVHSAPARPQRAPQLMRRIEIACLAPSGEVVDLTRLVPAIPAFDQAVAGLARGTLVPTKRGPIAVEDLWPGDRVKTASGMFVPLEWRGATMIVAGVQGQDRLMGRLTRIAADAMSPGRPEPDLVLGPWARLVRRAPALRPTTGQGAALVPARDYVDGDMIVEIIPPSPVEVFHLGFQRHERLVVHGIEVESVHPGAPDALGLSPEMLGLWLSCFPNKSSLAEFGPPCLPRLRRDELEMFGAC